MSDTDRAPAHISDLAERRAQSRRERDFETADRLKAEIEASGWRVVDSGPAYRLEPAHAPNVVADGVVRYGSSAGIPSLLDEPPTMRATVVVPDGADMTDLPPDVQVLHPSAAASPSTDLADDRVEVVPTASALGLAADWNIGIRRSLGAVVVLLAPGVGIGGEAIGPIGDNLDDESVAVVGTEGLASTDLRRWQPAPAGEVDALGPSLLAFRRADAHDRGPLDERFSSPLFLAVWWSLVLRDQGTDNPPRRALALDLPSQLSAETPEHARETSAGDGGEMADRSARRDFYRIVDRFGRRLDLLREPVMPTPASARARPQRRRPR